MNRTRLFSLFQYMSWTATAGMWVYALTQYEPAQHRFAPSWVWFCFMLFLGVSVAVTFIRERMRLQDSILDAFRVGLELKEDLRHKREKL